MDMGVQSPYTEVALGLLPQSHIYALVVICHATTYRGDQVISLPKFELRQYLEAIQRFKINTLYLVSRSISRPAFSILIQVLQISQEVYSMNIEGSQR